MVDQAAAQQPASHASPPVRTAAIAAIQARQAESAAAGSDSEADCAKAMAQAAQSCAKGRSQASKAVAPVIIARADTQDTVIARPAPAQAAEPGAGDEDEWAGYEPWTPDRPNTYRTVCVRLCDGAYFPVSFSTTRDRFKADAARCRNSCGSPARLFVSKLPSEQPEDLVDTRGALYTELPNAFKFRTTYDATCTCHGQPWEEASTDRHRKLAALAAATRPAQPTLKAAADVPGQPANFHQSHQRVAMHDAAGPAQPVTAAAAATATPEPVPAPTVATRRPAEPTTKRVAAIAQDAAEPEQEATAASAPKSAAPPKPEPAAKRTNPATRTKPAESAESSEAVLQKPSAPAVRKAAIKPSVAQKPAPRSVSQRTVVARADGASHTQRSFKSSDYWRLSYWQPN